MTSYPHGALVLWLIRQGIATTWSALCEHFSYGFPIPPTQLYQLNRVLIALHGANFITVEGGPIELHWDHPRSGPDASFSITPFAPGMLHSLDLSLSELAKSDPQSRMVLNPVLERLADTQYESDILVFMPFADALRPVYDDHLKAVAKKLGLSIKRADDFFTVQQIVGDIWSALLETKLVVADCTGRNPNVFYELGLAHAVGTPTILVTQSADDVPFDLRHRRYIEYELTPRGMKSFEEQLEQTISFTLPAP